MLELFLIFITLSYKNSTTRASAVPLPMTISRSHCVWDIILFPLCLFERDES